MNIPEILVANGTGAVLVSFLLLLRVRGESKNSVGTALFCRILVVTLLAQATETISFLLDGVPGAASRFWLYLTNTICTGATVCVGYAWCLYVDFRVYRSIGRLRRRHLLLGAPLLAAVAAGAAGRGVRRALTGFPAQGLPGQLAVLTVGGTVTAIVFLLAALPLGLWEELRAVLRQAKTGKNRGK